MSTSASTAHAESTASMWEDLDRVTSELTLYVHELSCPANGRLPSSEPTSRFKGITLEDWRHHLLRWCEHPRVRARLSAEWLDGLSCAVSDFADDELKYFLASFFLDAQGRSGQPGLNGTNASGSRQ